MLSFCHIFFSKIELSDSLWKLGYSCPFALQNNKSLWSSDQDKAINPKFVYYALKDGYDAFPLIDSLTIFLKIK